MNRVAVTESSLQTGLIAGKQDQSMLWGMPETGCQAVIRG